MTKQEEHAALLRLIEDLRDLGARSIRLKMQDDQTVIVDIILSPPPPQTALARPPAKDDDDKPAERPKPRPAGLGPY